MDLADSFIIDLLVSDGGDLFCMSVELWHVFTCAADFIVGVDKTLWIGSGLFQKCGSFFCTQPTVFGDKFFDHTDRVALSDGVVGDSFMLCLEKALHGGIGLQHVHHMMSRNSHQV